MGQLGNNSFDYTTLPSVRTSPVMLFLSESLKAKEFGGILALDKIA